MVLRVMLIVAISLATAVSLFAQTQVANAWSTLSPNNEEFMVGVPVELHLEAERGTKSSRRYSATVNGTYLYIFSDPINAPGNLLEVGYFVDSCGKSFSVSDYPAPPRHFEFDDGMGYFHIVKVVRTESRSYILQTVSKTTDDATAKRFSSSFRVKERALNQADEKQAAAAAEPADVEPKALGVKPELMVGGRRANIDSPGSGIGSGTGTGSGIGSGSGGGPAPTVAKPGPGQVTGLRILAKPRAQFTHLARFYGITGKVILRVTFLASGKVGDATAVTTLPFGLTQQAIAAARSITFEPATHNGVARSAIKPVEYSFVLY